MKLGLRTPSLKRRFAARTSWKRYVRNNLGVKAPRGWGFATNPKRAIYNRLYNRASFSVDKLFRSSHKSSSNSVGWSFLFNVIILLVLLGFFFPLAIIFLVYKLYKYGKRNTPSQNASLQSNSIFIVPKNNNLVAQFQIPEPTRSLLWVTDEDTSKIQNPMSVQISIDITKRTIDEKDGHNFYGEPSLIWTKLQIEPNDELETKPMYYPSYSQLFPKNRYQYLKWLTDVTKETNLSYVFLYYYGLERHLLVGDYDAAVDEILRLIKYHDKGTFKGYATTALIIGSGYRKRPEIIEKAPFIFKEISPVSLYLRRMAHKPLSAENVITLASHIGFYNKRYIQKYPDLFEEKLQSKLDIYQEQYGDILQHIDISKLPNDGYAMMANVSLPDDIRINKFPDLWNSLEFKSVLKDLLEETHASVKDSLSRKAKQ